MTKITGASLYEKLAEKNIDPDGLQELVVKALAERGQTAATAESCTGGLISKRITEVSGASAVFECGVCSYANRIKEKVLGVSGNTLSTVGAVSSETAEQMAQGVRKLADADFGVSTTGIAGPTGGTLEKPVGLVYIGVSHGEHTEVIRAEFGDLLPKTREAIRKAASDAALFFLLMAVRREF